MQVGGRIRALRKSREAKMTSTDLARMADISQSYVIEIESGKKNPSLEVLSRIARALDEPLLFVRCCTQRERAGRTQTNMAEK